MISRTLLALFLLSNWGWAASAEVPANGSVLVSYGFDDDNLELDGNKLFLFQNASGRVGYSSEFALSGYQSIELQEGQFDEEFTELQGRFPEQSSGILRFHFAILVENPEEELNIAVAGHKHFRVKKDGIAFWLHTQDGVLIHETDGIPRKLFSIEPFQWYFFDIVYDIDRGRYDLYVDSESKPAALIELKDQPNASNNPRSGIDRFSFIGDLGDRSRVHYFIDDVVLTQYPSIASARRSTLEAQVASRAERKHRDTAPPAELSTFSPPPAHRPRAHGARRGYLDGFLEMQSMLRQTPRCLPATSPNDLGLDGDAVENLLVGVEGANLEDRLSRALASEEISPSLVPTKKWVAGCVLLRKQRPTEARIAFESALKSQPDNTLFKAAKTLALAAVEDFEDADILLLDLEKDWSFDPRLPALRSYVQSLKGKFSDAKNALALLSDQLKTHPEDHILGEFLAGDSTDQLLQSLRRDYPSEWRKRLDDLFVAQNYYYNVLWSSDFKAAESYAHDIYAGLTNLKIKSLSWLEREADAAYFAGDRRKAATLYQEILLQSSKRRVTWRKLLDVAHQLSDRKFEQTLRRRFARELQ